MATQRNRDGGDNTEADVGHWVGAVGSGLAAFGGALAPPTPVASETTTSSIDIGTIVLFGGLAVGALVLARAAKVL